jgi:undecaprenyl-diphosphatase
MRKKRTDKKINTSKISLQKYLGIGLAGVIATILGFILDNIIFRIVNIITYPALNNIFILITTLGEPYIFLVISLILIIAMLMYNKKVLSFILALSTAFLVQWLLKVLVSRHRPFEIGLTSTNIAANSGSFPSGHALMFFTFIPILAKKFPASKLFFWTTAILVGFSRIYLGVHYTSDVIAGAFIGYIIGWLFVDIESRYRWKI